MCYFWRNQFAKFFSFPSRKKKERIVAHFSHQHLRVVGFNRRRVYRLFPGPWRFISFSPRKQHDNREPVDAPLFLGRELLPVPRTPDLHLLRRLRNGVAISSVIPTNYTPIPIKYEQRAASRSLPTSFEPLKDSARCFSSSFFSYFWYEYTNVFDNAIYQVVSSKFGE